MIILLLAAVSAWQLPGLMPKNYEKGQRLDFMVGQLESLHTTMTFDFYMLNWCQNPYGLGYD